MEFGEVEVQLQSLVTTALNGRVKD